MQTVTLTQTITLITIAWETVSSMTEYKINKHSKLRHNHPNSYSNPYPNPI